ncbi:MULTISPECIES: hypothetical protein [unclassified Pseudovibrio]|uniref:hypothetical protein n=1 Tax=unclassified Pseudovibrio TaxID=2627060 RepID=UPI0007AE44AC|nr:MULTISPECIES: hypothetical protein [unclassified Pseudovibrio]KZK97283.1 hypothetical protein PsW74_03723 [Pseudovibrio sp. W74]KZL08969.1 hypothetical protein PsAD14_02548 [Pseudovibrio sp. Ad14]
MDNQSDKKTAQPEAAKDTGVIGKLKAYRAANQGDATFTLPQTQVIVEFPKFRKHGAWTQVLAMAKNKIAKAQILYICKVCTFDGEKLSEADWRTYIPMEDANELMGEIFGGSDEELEEDDEGNGSTAAA